MIRSLIKRMKEKACKHHWVAVSSEETGKLCFSFNCARPQILVTERCSKCDAEKNETYMSGDPNKALPLTPEVAGILLHDEFGHPGKDSAVS